MKPNLAPLDYGLIAAYFAAVIAIGLVTARQQRHLKVGGNTGQESENYLLAGRKMSLPAFVATLVATWYGGILGVGESAYTSGLVTWVIFGLPYYLFAIVYAFFLASRIRASVRLTIPDTLEAIYNRPVALVGAIFVFLMVSPAPNLLMLATLLKDIFGIPLLAALILGMLVSIAFVATGGLNTDIRTNALQFVLMFASFALLLIFALVSHPFHWLPTALPPLHTTLTGDYKLPALLVWYFIALQTIVDPGFHQRCSAAKSARTAQTGILLSVLCWAIFDFCTVSTGLYARALLPDLKEPLNAYPALAEVLLPTGAKGFFWVGMLATVMGATLSYTFLAAITLGRDFAYRLLNRRGAEARGNDIAWTRIGIGATAVLSVAFALVLPSVVGQWYVIGSAFVPGLLLPLLGGYFPALRVSAPFALTGMLLGAGFSILWIALGAQAAGLGNGHYPLDWEPMYVGLGMSAAVWGAGLGWKGNAVEPHP